MKKIAVKWFAAYREATGAAVESIETSAASVADLFDEMTQIHTDLASFRGALVAINDEMTHWDAGFSDGDEILFFPPVAGG